LLKIHWILRTNVSRIDRFSLKKKERWQRVLWRRWIASSWFITLHHLHKFVLFFFFEFVQRI
jgi:hypothetical protein